LILRENPNLAPKTEKRESCRSEEGRGKVVSFRLKKKKLCRYGSSGKKPVSPLRDPPSTFRGRGHEMTPSVERGKKKGGRAPDEKGKKRA